MAEWAGGQLGGKAVVGAAAAVGAAVAIEAAAAIKDKEGDIQDKEALNALFNETIKYLVVNNYISAISELYIQQLKGKALLPLQGAKLLTVLNNIYRNKDWI